MLDVPDGAIDFVDRPVDMTDGTIAQTANDRVVFLARHVSMNLVQQICRAVQTGTTVARAVDRRMIVKVLAVVYGRAPDFVDRRVDLADRRALVATDRRIAGAPGPRCAIATPE